MESELDKISQLPSHITDQILSCLPIKDAVRTSILSRKWRYKWSSVPVLVFDDQCTAGASFLEQKLVKIVDNVLLLHAGPIRKFKLSHREFNGTSDIDRWILHLSRVSVKEFVLDVWKGQVYYKIPSSLFNYRGLIHLELFRCSLDIPLTFNKFKSLVSLDLQHVALTQAALETLISRHPTLKRLTLKNLNLEKLDGATRVNIKANNLQCIDLEGDSQDFTFGVMNHLKSVSIDFHGKTVNEHRLAYANTSNRKEFFLSLGKIERLKFENYSLKFLVVGKVLQRPPFLHRQLEYLFACINFTNMEEVGTVMYLLKSSPNLKKVEFEVREGDQTVIGTLDDFEDEGSCYPLKQLKVALVSGIHGRKSEMDFVKFLLSSSPGLQTMTVQPSSSIGEVELLKELLQLRRASALAELIMLDPPES